MVRKITEDTTGNSWFTNQFDFWVNTYGKTN